MNKLIPALLDLILLRDQHHAWLLSYNTNFDMSPMEMINQGREKEVIEYLKYVIDGPY